MIVNFRKQSQKRKPVTSDYGDGDEWSTPVKKSKISVEPEKKKKRGRPRKRKNMLNETGKIPEKNEE